MSQKIEVIKKEKIKEIAQSVRIHSVLAHSYSFYLIAFLVGFFFDFIFQFTIFNHPIILSIGFILIIFSSILIFWAQNTSRNLKNKILTKDDFLIGPYRFSRSPTHWGLSFLMLGFGFLVNGFFIVLFTVISFFITKFIFLREEESILAQKYGEPYLEYKKLVRV